MSRHFDAIFFDFDGVLVDSEPVHFDCWRAILGAHGVDLDWDTYAANGIGVSDRALIEFMASLRTPPLDVDHFYTTEYPRKKALYLERSLQCVPMAPATAELLASLDDYRLAVVSSSARPEVEALLDRAGVLTRFETLVCAREANRLKPAPDPYLRAAELLNTRRALVVEDSEAGVASGLAAGFPVLRIHDPATVPGMVRQVLETGVIPG